MFIARVESKRIDNFFMINSIQLIFYNYKLHQNGHHVDD